MKVFENSFDICISAIKTTNMGMISAIKFLEDNNKYLALCVLREFPEGIMYLREIQSLYKGYGKNFIQLLLDKYNNFWWTADYSSGEELLNYYRQFDVKEYNIGPTKWSNGIDHHIFYKADNKHNENKIITIANSWRNL